jgi:hypothetical protein
MLRLIAPTLRKPVRIDLSENPELVGSMSLQRRNVMDQIIALNPSASAEFLEQFDDAALSQYLDHLNIAQQPRGKDARWVRPHGKPWAFAAAACA